jgi:hypothetical protein
MHDGYGDGDGDEAAADSTHADFATETGRDRS